jgi:hypothetical protein
MTGNKDLLSCIDSSISFDITLGNDSLVKVQGKGIIPILTKQNVKKDIHNVYHVPNLTHNLLSVGQLIEHGYKVLFEGASCVITLNCTTHAYLASGQLISFLAKAMLNKLLKILLNQVARALTLYCTRWNAGRPTTARVGTLAGLLQPAFT